MSNSSKKWLASPSTSSERQDGASQLHQDNTVKGVKKLDEGQTMVCYICHKEGHKSYECKMKNGGGAKKKEKKANKQALQHLHQQSGQEGLHTLSLEEEEK